MAMAAPSEPALPLPATTTEVDVPVIPPDDVLAPRAVVVIGPGQVVTSVVLRSLGWEVALAPSTDEAAHLALREKAALIFVRISSSYLRSMRCPPSSHAAVVAIVDSDDDAQLPGFDATISIDDLDELSSFIRSAAPTTRWVRPTQ
jgi:hypothetical protein